MKRLMLSMHTSYSIALALWLFQEVDSVKDLALIIFGMYYQKFSALELRALATYT